MVSLTEEGSKIKKTYNKPIFFVESFQLKEHIAVTCGESMGSNAASITTCTYGDENYANLLLFTDAVTGCMPEVFVFAGVEPSVENIKELGLTCYNSFQMGDNLFTS